MSILEQHLRRYVILRLVVIATIAVVYSFAEREPAELFPGGVALRLLALAVPTLLYLVLRRPLRRYPQVQAWIQFASDLVLISSMVYVTGGPTSAFSPLYLIVISSASTLLRGRAGTAAAAVAFLLYASTLLPRIQETPSELLAYSLMAHFVGFFAVDRLTSFLARTAERAGEDLADLEVVHRDVIESIPSGISTTDLGGVVTTVNRAGTQILGKDLDDLLGHHIVSSGLLTRELWERLTEASRDGSRQRQDVELHRGGEMVNVGFSISRLADSDGSHRGYIVIFQDLTPWRRLEEEVRIKDRMAAVGEMAAGLAHEIGNPLAAISGSVQMLSGSPARDPGQRKLLDILLKESQRLDRTIKGFLRFARPKDRTTVQFDIGALLAENVELLRNSDEVSPGHEVNLRLDPPSVNILGDPDQISQIFWNLARNALKAMPGGGQLTVSGTLGSQTYTIRFTDTGRGMSEEERANLFHPFKSFFDSGSGIGMAIVYRIVQEHGGDLKVASAPGAGSCITVELPAVALAEVAQ